MQRIKFYLCQWSVMRVLRLIMGILIIVQGFQADQWIIVGLGILFTILPLMNLGCSANALCVIPRRRQSVNKSHF